MICTDSLQQNLDELPHDHLLSFLLMSFEPCTGWKHAWHANEIHLFPQEMQGQMHQILSLR